MRIVTWNCCGGFVSKAKANELLALNPDIAIVPEVLSEDANCLEQHGYRSIWVGDPGQKGLAILNKSPWTLCEQGTPLHKWIVPISVSGPETFTLIAVWPVLPGGRRSPEYVKVIRQALAAHPDWLSQRPVVMAGDFNSHWKFDTARRKEFASLFADLTSHGFLSAYHLHYGEDGAHETKHTFYQKNCKPHKPFHIDYIFIPADWKARLSYFALGYADYWLRFSDHCPLIIDIAPST